ncbi:MAG: heparinase II/III-family protein [Candidatus Devosia symbiotica]|nr:heparinase II/III-family protein [Candidatus Devosia symbiotica]
MAQSGPKIDAEDVASSPSAVMSLAATDQLLTLTTAGYARRFGIDLERLITLLSGSTTLIGQDRMIAHGNPSGLLAIRFHLASGVQLQRNCGEGIVRLMLPNGAI